MTAHFSENKYLPRRRLYGSASFNPDSIHNVSWRKNRAAMLTIAQKRCFTGPRPLFLLHQDSLSPFCQRLQFSPARGKMKRKTKHMSMTKRRNHLPCHFCRSNTCHPARRCRGLCSQTRCDVSRSKESCTNQAYESHKFFSLICR